MGRALSEVARLSLWHASAEEDWAPRPPLPGDRDTDVAVVGAGLTGLWTVHYLAEADPTLRVTVVESQVAGYGASGRNGGGGAPPLPPPPPRGGGAAPLLPPPPEWGRGPPSAPPPP